MECSQESYSLCSLFMVSFVGIIFYNYDTVLDFMIHGTGKGKVRISKGNTTVDSNMGTIHLPNIKLPSLDWEVKLFKDTDDNSSIKDGLNDLETVSSLNTMDCKITSVNNFSICLCFT